MEKTTLKIGSILKCEDKTFIIIFCNSATAVLCELNTNKLKVISVQSIRLFNSIEAGQITIEEKTDSDTVIKIDELTENQKTKYENDKNLIAKFNQLFGPDYIRLSDGLRLNNFEELKEGYPYSDKTMWKTIRKYLQSGCDVYSLLPREKKKALVNYKTKTGRPTTFGLEQGVIIDDDVLEKFNYGVEHYRKGRKHSVKESYNEMLSRFYVGTYEDEDGVHNGLLPDDKRPTLSQFTYYLKKQIPPDEIEKIKTSKREYRNDSRILYSDSLDSVMGPFDILEMDECEVDVKLVSEKDRGFTISRPILYLLIDLFTRMIVGFSIGLENNSVLGLCNSLLSLIDDKKQLCAKNGIEVPSYFWPDHLLPNKIRTDYGAEYISHEGERIFSELNITQDTVPPAMGSLKGSVEQWFHQMHSAQNPLLENKGMISKRHDSKHNQQAVMTLSEFREFALMYIIEHNSRRLENYPLSKEMIAEGMNPCPTPFELYDFGVRHYGQPRPISNENMFRYTLLKNCENASLTRYGITYKNLHYIDPLDSFLTRKISALGNRHSSFECRIDPRDISQVFYLNEGKLISVPLSSRRDSDTFIGWTLTEYLDYDARKKIAKKEADRHNTSNSIARRELQKGIISKALTKETKNSKKTSNIRQNSREEKIEDRKQNPIFKSDRKLPEPVMNEDKELELDLTEIEDDPLKALESFKKREIKQLKED